jgi:anti-sigma regulatory factor (Ser/Thr protein kinase)
VPRFMTVKANFDRTVEAVALARHFSGEVLGGVATDVVLEVMLMVSELATNAIVHAGTTFGLSIERADRWVRVEVVDGGSGDVQMLAPSMGDSQGRGLQLVELLSDRWGTTSLTEGGKVVWFVRNLFPATGLGPLADHDLRALA